MKIAAALVFVVTALVACLLLIPQDDSQTVSHTVVDSIKENAFSRLTAIRRQKKAEVVGYFTAIENKAENAGNDQQLRTIFIAGQQQNNPEQEYRFDEIYASRYGEFYDLLMVDPSGFVFNSVRKEADYLGNIFTGRSPLVQKSELNRERLTFIDYKQYAPSQESASFFFVPIIEKETFAGWLVLQCPINKINWILSDREGLGRTGEVYLVNQQMLLLSESRFINESSALKLKVDTEAVRNALSFETGEQIVEDYRGVRVYSSFERFKLFGSTWIIIAEKDEAEILTKAFLQMDVPMYPAIAALAQKQISNDRDLPRPLNQGSIIDVNEFQRSADGSVLRTYGVASCTAVLIQFPSRFAYLAHISPTDEIYPQSDNYGQNLLRQLLHRITYFDLLPVEKKDLQFVLIAPHAESLKGAINTILESGFDLANIRVAIDKTARGANIVLQPYGQLSVEWYGKGAPQRHNALLLPTVQDLFSELVGYN